MEIMLKSLKNRKIRWGIIGLGNIAHKFSTDLLAVDDAELYAVASRSQEKATIFADKYNAVKAYDSYKELVNDTHVDAIYIATPHSFHKEHTMLCLNHKKAVLCEKPIALNFDEFDTMVTLAKTNNVLFMEALWTNFLPHYQYAINELKNKTLGNIIKLEADFGFKPEFDVTSRVYKKSLGGGSLLDIGIYPIFVAISTLGVPESIEAEATFYDNGVDSSCSMIFNYNNDIKAILKSTFLEETQTEAIFHCEKGELKINPRFHQPTTVSIISGGKEKTSSFDTSTHGYNFEILHFNQLLRDGKTESDIMTFELSKKLIQTLDSVRKIIGLNY